VFLLDDPWTFPRPVRSVAATEGGDVVHAGIPRGRALLAAALLAAATAVLVPSGAAGADPTVLRNHPHEGTVGALPTAAGEGYATRTGTAAAYTATATDGATSVRFAGTAATYFEDAALTTSTGTLVWSAPVQLPSLPAAGTTDRFLAARTNSAALASVAVAPTGRLQLRNGAGTVKATGAAALATGTWYRVEVRFSGGTTTVRLFDSGGALLDTVGPTAVTAGTPSRLRTGAVAKGGPLLIDRVQVADDWLTPLPAPPPPPPSPCGLLTYDPENPPVYDSVVVLMEENWSYADFAASTQSPYLTGLAAECGNETNFHAVTHPSQPNYMAATSGVASKVGVTVANDNVFHQLQDAGLSWRSYQESMTGTCMAGSKGTYKPGHNPAVYYSDLRSPTNTCALWDVPLSPALDDDIAGDDLPAYAWVTPNLCHDFHWQSGCGFAAAQATAQGDAWLESFLPRLTALPSYQAGHVLIVVTFDEGREDTNTTGVDCTAPEYYGGHPDCQIPTVVISPYIAAGGQSDPTDLNLYSLLRTTEDNFGLPYLGRAATASSMRTGNVTF
jgi:hypothetical protein